MCGRYVLIEKIEFYEEQFKVKANALPNQYLPNYNVSIGNFAPVITNDKPNEIQFFQFGFTPSWSKKPMYLFNARSEGDGNETNDIHYTGGKGIISKPAFRKAIRSQRCLVIADYFIEGTVKEKLDKPFMVYLRHRRPFAFAGLWETWVNHETGEVINTFCIITTFANALMQQLPHHRSPVILRKEDEHTWLHATDLNEITSLLQPYDANEMNAYPISNHIKSPKANTIELLQPLGAPVYTDENFSITHEIKLQGMGQTKRNERKN